jgi:UDP-N-acetylmuramate dehydrogenase
MTSLNSHSKELTSFWKGEILWDRPMSQYSTFKVGGPAEAVVTVKNSEDLKRLINWLQSNNISWWIVGRGSNILVPDNGLPGVTILLEGKFDSVEILDRKPEQHQETTIIRAGGGCLLSKLLNFCSENSLSGLEFTVGIPGSLGGAVVMNAGAWDYEIGDLLETATLLNKRGEIFTESKENLGFTYRGWGMEPRTLLLYATLALTAGNREEIKSTCRKYHELRKTSQPLSEPSGGSFFKNPPDQSAGRLIDEAGLKGYAIGGAKVSEKHANFIVNTGNASAADIINLMHHVQETVFKRFGVSLEPEVHILGDQG